MASAWPGLGPSDSLLGVQLAVERLTEVAGAESFFFHLWDPDWNSWNCSFPVLLEDCLFRPSFSPQTLANKLLLLFCLYFFRVCFNCLQAKNLIVDEISLLSTHGLFCSLLHCLGWLLNCGLSKILPWPPWWLHWRDSNGCHQEQQEEWESEFPQTLISTRTGRRQGESLASLGLSSVRAFDPKWWQDFGRGEWWI